MWAYHPIRFTIVPCSSDKMIKELKERLLKAKGNPSFLENVQDINVVCGVLKDFLRNLRESLLTFRMHNAFMQAAGEGGEGDDGHMTYLNLFLTCTQEVIQRRMVWRPHWRP